MPWLRLPSNGTSSSGLHGQQMSRWFFTFFCKHSKSTSASSFSPLFNFYSHTITFDLSLSTKENFNTLFFQLQSQLPARAQVWAAVGGGKEAGAGRFVLLSPQRFSKLLHFTFYLMSHHNASSKWSPSLQAMGPIWLARLKWREFRMNFASYYTGVAFSDLLRTVFFPQEPGIVFKPISNSQVLGGSRWSSQSC